MVRHHLFYRTGPMFDIILCVLLLLNLFILKHEYFSISLL